MNQALESVIKLYFIKKDELKQHLTKSDKEKFIKIIYDKNSSTLREMITILIAANGYKGEIKNVDTNSNRKYEGSGNFTDFTYNSIVVSGFVDGNLIFVYEFTIER